MRSMGSDLTGHLAVQMGPELTASIVHNSGIKNIGKLVGQMGGGITGGWCWQDPHCNLLGKVLKGLPICESPERHLAQLPARQDMPWLPGVLRNSAM